MADYSRPFSEEEALAGRERVRQREAEEYRVGFKVIRRSAGLGGFTPTTEFTECLGCGCLVGDRDVHREKCPWVPRVPKTTYIEET